MENLLTANLDMETSDIYACVYVHMCAAKIGTAINTTYTCIHTYLYITIFTEDGTCGLGTASSCTFYFTFIFYDTIRTFFFVCFASRLTYDGFSAFLYVFLLVSAVVVSEHNLLVEV